MRVAATMLGVALGLAAAAWVLPMAGRWQATGGNGGGEAISDCDGAIEAVVIQYVSGAGEVVGPVYRAFLCELPGEVVVYAVCGSAGDFAELKRWVGPVRCEVRPIVVGHAISAWSRDRWVALAGAAGRTTLWCAAEEDGAADWPARAGDQQVAMDIAAAMRSGIDAQRSGLLFDGGDFVADERCVFVNGRLVMRNVQHTVKDEAELRGRLEARLRKRVVMLDHSPDHHAGMYLMAIGEGRVMVGDPSAARGLIDAEQADEMVGGADWSQTSQEKFDAVARECEAAGYQVMRMPVVAGTDGRTWLTGLNVIIDERQEKRTVYMPVYRGRGMEGLNAEAERVWRSAGYEVTPIDCTTTYRHFGSLRCLVNVMKRG